MRMGIVVNKNYLAGGFKPGFHAKINYGFLDLVIVKDSRGLEFLTSLINIKTEDHSDNLNIIY